jgi:hypothetical protein
MFDGGGVGGRSLRVLAAARLRRVMPSRGGNELLSGVATGNRGCG